MARYTGRLENARLWFPRPRGDGPVKRTAITLERGVSPPTRGWPREIGDMLARMGGFPAHAGMAPWFRNMLPAAYRFPRPRGDGPFTRLAEVYGLGVSPPTRGWPGRAGLMYSISAGFPAHAGMARLDYHRCSRIIRFPRPHGDGPPLDRVDACALVVSPPTRGGSGKI